MTTMRSAGTDAVMEGEAMEDVTLGTVQAEQLATVAKDRILYTVEARELVEGEERGVFYEYLPACRENPAIILRRVRALNAWGAWSPPRQVTVDDLPEGLVWMCRDE